MDIQQQGIITLVRSGLLGCAYPLPESFDFSNAFKIALRHNIVALIYYGAVNCGIDKDSEEMKALFQRVVATMQFTAHQRKTIECLLDIFEKSNIEYMPVKGYVLQTYYPSTEMRTMGDSDILIRLEQYEQIQQIMIEQGYMFLRENDHELAWSRGDIEIEFHKRIIPTHNKDFYAYFGDGWERARKDKAGSSAYTMTDEDFYIYIFTHFTKHYRSAGIGIKHITDLWVYRKAKPTLDEGYIEEQLSKLNLLEFHNNILKTINAWFEGSQQTQMTQHITDVIFANGVFGRADNRRMSEILKKAVSAGSVKKITNSEIRRTIFLSYKHMCLKYPILKKLPFLLPVYWVVRGIEVFLFKNKKVRSYLGKNSALNEGRLEHHKQALNYVGLKFDL